LRREQSFGYERAGNTGRLIAQGMSPALAATAAMRQQSDIIKGVGAPRAFLESQSPSVVFVAATGNESERPKFVLDASLPAAELFSVGAVGLTGNGTLHPFPTVALRLLRREWMSSPPLRWEMGYDERHEHGHAACCGGRGVVGRETAHDGSINVPGD
jgi:hypothetical protein